MEAFLDGEWECLSKLFSCEDSDVHFEAGDFFAETPAIPTHHHYLNSVSQESSNNNDDYLLHHHHLMDSMNYSNMESQNQQGLVMTDDLMEEILQLKAQMGDHPPAPGVGKRPRVSKDAPSRKRKKGRNEQSCSSDSENGKTKATKSPATDSQSLYARKRRERINERLRMLQNLVPNGTKVDISTMLEEAVHYVKFLQLQIKLLSSDDMWMYAPIAYNGMDMGLYHNINNIPNI